jgi:hypothetical protein
MTALPRTFAIEELDLPWAEGEALAKEYVRTWEAQGDAQVVVDTTRAKTKKTKTPTTYAIEVADFPCWGRRARESHAEQIVEYWEAKPEKQRDMRFMDQRCRELDEVLERFDPDDRQSDDFREALKEAGFRLFGDLSRQELLEYIEQGEKELRKWN